jgi:hypothetical protein
MFFGKYLGEGISQKKEGVAEKPRPLLVFIDITVVLMD